MKLRRTKKTVPLLGPPGRVYTEQTRVLNDVYNQHGMSILWECVQ